MAPVKHEIPEHDVVTLREPVGNWPAGTLGAVVSDCYRGTFLVEIDNPGGELLDNIIPVSADGCSGVVAQEIVWHGAATLRDQMLHSSVRVDVATSSWRSRHRESASMDEARVSDC